MAERTTNYSKLITIFNNLQKKDDFDDEEMTGKAVAFILQDDSFIYILNSLLVCSTMNLPIKISSFLKKIIHKLQIEKCNSLINSLFTYLLQFTSSNSVRARKNSLQLLLIFIEEANLNLSNDVVIKISECLFDKEGSVRNIAVKICIHYQENILNDRNLKVKDILKSILSHDKNSKVRKYILQNIIIDYSTIRVVTERCIDLDKSIRNTFFKDVYIKVMNFLKFNDECKNHLLLLFKVSFKEIKSELINYVTSNYTLNDFVYYFKTNDNILKSEYAEVIRSYLINHIPDDLPESIEFLNVFYDFIESNYGRDSLKLKPIEFLLEKNDLNYSVLFKYYDFILEEDQNKILKYLRNTILNTIIYDVDCYKNCFELIDKIFYNQNDRLEKFIGTLIHKSSSISDNLTEKLISSFFISRIGDDLYNLNNAIINEIILPKLENNMIFLTSLYNYLLYNTKDFDQLVKVYKEFLNKDYKVLEGLTDLVLFKKIPFSEISFMEQYDENLDENKVKPISKLLLSAYITNTNQSIVYLLKIFYLTETNYIQQYLSCFFYEYFRKNNTNVLVSVFIEVLLTIEKYEKVFIDQTFYWLSLNKRHFDEQQLDLVILITAHLINNMSDSKLLYPILLQISYNKDFAEKIKVIINNINEIIEFEPKENYLTVLNLLDK
ncbi:hypothetical protein HERIO_1246 [Hepatospora eriocheir]|uniref:Uncharacterized protein n=1 Tax=Hepatospora eriocheir TaxID=1081669 RepID=A0A1X0QAV0_9MICR|nr:hypothetical protein HERIO_1246 [Hepatospora eriocheir]